MTSSAVVTKVVTVCVQSALNANVKKFRKARINGGYNCDSLKDSQKSLLEPPFLDLGQLMHSAYSS